MAASSRRLNRTVVAQATYASTSSRPTGAMTHAIASAQSIGSVDRKRPPPRYALVERTSRQKQRRELLSAPVKQTMRGCGPQFAACLKGRTAQLRPSAPWRNRTLAFPSRRLTQPGLARGR